MASRLAFAPTLALAFGLAGMGDLPLFCLAGTVPAWVVRGLSGRRGPCRPLVQQTTRSNNCRFPDGRYCDMMAECPGDETIALRATVIDGNGYPDD
jgi:hypothetical protein